MNSDQIVRFVPLGGLGEIGMNCFALEQGGKILVVDCGVSFPDDDLGVEVLHPDFSWLISRKDDLVGLFITHGHEDHIGAIPYLLEALGRPLPIFAPRHAHALIGNRMEERGFDSSFLHLVELGAVYPVGPFQVEAIAVAHSIVEATALCIQSAAGVILHTGDFDLDDEPVIGHRTDSQRLQELGEQGIRLLLSDSTNIDQEIPSSSEADVARALSDLISTAPGRVVVGIFSSNLHRIAALVKAAQASERKLCFLGRSLQSHQRLAKKLGILEIPSDLLVSPKDLQSLPRNAVLVVASGSQGEGPSALRRLSAGSLPNFFVEEGDTLILSSRVIPGNERAVFLMLNAFARQGLRVVSSRTHPEVHVSGHANREELSRMIQWLKPEACIPVHGTLHHLRAHGILAKELGVMDTQVVENGASVEFAAKGTLRLGAALPHGLVRISLGGTELLPALRRKRGELARSGVIFVSLLIDEQDDALLSCQLVSLGVVGVDEDDLSEGRLRRVIATTTEAYKGRRMLSLEEVVQRALRAEIRKISRERPKIEVRAERVTSPFKGAFS